MRRRLLLTTALVAPAIALAPHRAGALGLAIELDGAGHVVAWINPEVLARLRVALDVPP